MKNILYILPLILTACGTTGTGFTNTEVLTQSRYIVRTAPDVLRTLPPLPTPLANPRTATNAQIASWINRTETYVANLEAQIRILVTFYEAPVTTAEAGNLVPVTPVQPAPNPRVVTPQSSFVSPTAQPNTGFTTPSQRLP